MIHPTSFPLWPLLLFLTITLISLRVPTCLCADDPLFLNCSSVIQCGNLQNISYPFWGSNRASYCGLGDEFQITCEDNTTALLTLDNLKYRLLSYDNSTKKLTVARDDYWGTFCPSTFYNSSQDPSPFAYASDTVANNLIFYYVCEATNVPANIPATSRFSCTISNNATIGCFVTRNVGDISTFANASHSTALSYYGECKTSVVVPAYVSAIEAIESSLLNTTVEVALQQGFGLQWTDANDACADCVGSGGKCGRDESSGDFTCHCSGGSTWSTCSGRTNRIPLGIDITIVVAAITGAVAIGIMIFSCQDKGFHRSLKPSGYVDNDIHVEVAINTNGFLAPRRYEYFELKNMTNSFTEKIGQGGYGTVYKGKLLDGRLVAVKLLIKSKGQGEEFINEVVSISRTSHVNVVNLFGFCYERNKRALIYEFMPNGSLDKFIPPEGALHTSSKIDWKILHEIVLGIARGLEYLHRGCKTRILHFDIKPQNILLDEDFAPKISDFGLAKLCLGKESMVSLLGIRGTVGYIAPEVFSRTFGQVSHKSDVYSYGMLVLTMVCGKSINNDQVSNSSSDMYFPHNIYKQLEPNRDFKFQGITTNEEEEIARKLMLVSLWCIQTNPSNRPSITKVIEMLEGSLHSLDMPPEPSLSYPMCQHQRMDIATPLSSNNKVYEEEESSLVVDRI